MENNHSIIPGQVFDQWTVVADPEFISVNSTSTPVWRVHCKCECGREKKVIKYRLVNGESTKCRVCAARDRQRIPGQTVTQDMKLGMVFGKLTVIEPNSQRTTDDKRWMSICRCECGNIKTVINYQLVHGNTRSCGCLRHEPRGTMAYEDMPASY